MKLFPRAGRRVSMPAEVSEALALGDLTGGNRLLAWSSLVGGGVAAATRHDLRIVTPRGEKLFRSWVDVDHAVWDQDSRTLVVWWVDTRRTTPLEIQDDVGRLPEVVRERVQASVVLTAGLPLPGRKPGRVALRRAADGELSAQSLLPPGVKADDPDVVPLVQAALAQLWAEAGDVGLNQGAPPSL